MASPITPSVVAWTVKSLPAEREGAQCNFNNNLVPGIVLNCTIVCSTTLQQYLEYPLCWSRLIGFLLAFVKTLLIEESASIALLL